MPRRHPGDVAEDPAGDSKPLLIARRRQVFLITLFFVDGN